ncbi:unnamed protein product [Clonostachys rosea]|uniref:Uncharacterized protein n=1 Tax=Bionectria ochroleuca TaxID=29856 RepID=A0ABY6UIP2_BIOOC|nr:unnamed protein product [Clonostachys rosea]
MTPLHNVTEDHISEEWWDTFAYKRGQFESLVPLWDRTGCSDGYRHVQLALKYSRLSANSGECRARLERLLTPFASWPRFPITVQDAVHPYLQAVPKVVQGRFIFKSTWTFDMEDGTILSPEIMGMNVPICNHLSFGRTRRLPDAVTNAIDVALENHGVTVHGCCESCPTDFTVQFRSAFEAEVTAWKDFGGEVSPLSDTWQANIFGAEDIKLGNQQRGRVRSLFEKASN